jgi:hypothetical protein
MAGPAPLDAANDVGARSASCNRPRPRPTAFVADTVDAVGSQGQRPRKPKRKQRSHTAAEQHEAHLHAEQDAVLDNMGLGNAPQWVKIVAVVLIVALVVGAIGGLLILTVR